MLNHQPTITTTGLAGSAVGSYPITVSGASSNNYLINHVPGTLTVIPAPAPSIASVNLLSPAQNSLCINGAIVNAAQSAVLFNWNAAVNTSSYDLTITNLLTSASTTQNFISNQA